MSLMPCPVLLALIAAVAMAMLGYCHATAQAAQASSPINNLKVHDADHADAWSVQAELTTRQPLFADENWLIEHVPTHLRKAAWVRTPNASRHFAGEALASFEVGFDADVYVGIDDRATEKPAWMADWIDSSMNIVAQVDGEPVKYNLYRYKTRPGFKAGQTVELGPNPKTAPTNCLVVVAPGEPEPVGWDVVPDILAQIQPPTFPDRTFDITDYGAVADGQTSCADAIRRAIAACHEAGGGRVLIPEGEYLCAGPIHLQSHVNLHNEGTVRFGRDPNDYLPPVFTTFEGNTCYNYSPFLYARDKTNIALTGPGTFDGQADDEHWWPWKDKQDPASVRLRQYNNTRQPVDVRVFGNGDYLRPELLQFVNCRNILVKDITLRNSPFWASLYTWCENVTVDGITVISHFANNDGCNPNGTRYMLIKDCDFHTGDDGVAIKAGRNYDGRGADRPSEYIVIQNCSFTADDSYRYRGNCLMAFGSEMSGGINHVYVENCKASGPVNTGVFKTKTSRARGGYIMNVYTRNIDISEKTGNRPFYKNSTNYGSGGATPDETWPWVYHNLNFEQ